MAAKSQEQSAIGLQFDFMSVIPLVLSVLFFIGFAFMPSLDGAIAGEIKDINYLRRIDDTLTGASLIAKFGPQSNAVFALVGWVIILFFSVLRLYPSIRNISRGFLIFGSLTALSHYIVTLWQVTGVDAGDVPDAMAALQGGFWVGLALTIVLLGFALLPYFAAGQLKQALSLDRVAEWVTPYMMMFMLIALHAVGPQLNRLDLRVMIFVLMWVGLTGSWNLVGGYTGYIDFGHSVFVGVGSYIVAVLVARLGILAGAESVIEQQQHLWPFARALPMAFFGGAIFAGLVGYPTLRLKGPYFSIAMLGVLVAGREITRNDFDINGNGITNGGVGISFLAPFSQPTTIYYTLLMLAGMITFISLWMYRVQIGKMLKAVRDDEVGADMRGINTTAIKVGIFMLAGGFTAMIGGTKAYSEAYVDPDIAFPPIYHITMIMMAMLGGLGRPWGPVVGATTFYFARERIWASAGSQHLMITGGLLIAIMLFMPGGILSLFDPEDRGLAWFIRTRLLGKKEKVFADDEDFEFQQVPDALLHERATFSPRNLAAAGHRIVLQGKRVTKAFGGLIAVNHVDFEIHEGEIVGLLGPNGSGKTTLFNCVSGVLPITEGQVYVDGKEVTGDAPWQINRAGLSRTFQRLRVYDKQKVYDNMLLARRWKGVPPFLWLWIAPIEVRTKADELIEFLKIQHVRNNLAQNLSGGQQRLLEMGMTLMNDPVVVLLDEATSGVNPALVENIKDDIRRLNRERGVTFFLVEHNMSFAMELCDRLYVLDYGQLIAHGTPEEIQNDERVIEAYFGRDN